MDITCSKCGKEYSLDETLVSSKGTAVRCTNCNNVFKAYKDTATEEPDEWIIRKPHGVSLTVESVSELKQWISERKISENDLLSKNNGPWKKIADIPELKQFFTKSRSRKAASAGFSRNEDSPSASTIRHTPGASSSKRGDFTARQVIFSRAPSPPSSNDDPDTKKENAKLTPSVNNALVVNEKPTLPPRPISARDFDSKTTTNIAKGSGSSSPPPAVNETSTAAPSKQAVHPLGTGTKTGGAKPAAGSVKKSPSTPRAEELAAVADPDLSQIPAVREETEWDTGSRIDVPEPEWANKTGSLPKYTSEKTAPRPPRRRIGRLVGILGSLGILGAALLIYVLMPNTADDVSSRLAEMVSSSEQDRFQQFFDRGRERFLLDSENAYLQADREFQKVLALQEKHPATLAALGQMHGVWAQYLRDRILDMEAATSNDAKKLNNGNTIGRLKAEFEERRKEALEWATRALQADPNLKEAHLAMADAKRLYGDLEEAATHLEKAKSMGTDAEVLYEEVLYNMDNGAAPNVLLKELDKAIAEQPLIRAMYRRARILGSMSKEDEARKELEHLFELNHNHQAGRDLADIIARGKPIHLAYTPHAMTGNATPSRGKSGKSPEKKTLPPEPEENPADAKFDDIAKEAPESTNERSLLLTAQKQLEKGQVSVAKESFKKIIDKSPNNVEALIGLAYCYLDQGNKGKAISYFRRALNNDHSSGAALIGLAETYKASGDENQALKYYRQYLETHPGGKQSGMAQRNIDKLSAKSVEDKVEPESPPPSAPTGAAGGAVPEPESTPQESSSEATGEEKNSVVVEKETPPNDDKPPPDEE